jgi:uncharacterized protein (DUF342 family)
MRQLERCEDRLAELNQRIVHQAAVAGHLPPDASELSRSLAAARDKQKRMQEHRKQLWDSLTRDEDLASHCRVLVPGTLYPGVEISIGRSSVSITRPLRNVMLRLEAQNIHIQPLPPPNTASAPKE